jgi:hypothetical protein
MRSFSKFLAVAAGLGCAASLAFAAEQTILGKSLTVKQKPGDTTSRKISGSANEKNSPNTLVGNPTLSGSAGGAILQVFANGAMSTAQTFTLPQGTGSTGKQFWSQSGNGFKYKDPTGDQGPVKSVSIKATPSGKFSIKAKVSAKHGTVNVVPPNPGISGCLALDLGISPLALGDRYSVQFGPDSQIKNSADKLFKAKKPSLEGICPSTTPTTTSSTTSTAVTPTTTTSSTSGSVPTTTTTSTTLYGSPSRAFLAASADLLD